MMLLQLAVRASESLSSAMYNLLPRLIIGARERDKPELIKGRGVGAQANVNLKQEANKANLAEQSNIPLIDV